MLRTFLYKIPQAYWYVFLFIIASFLLPSIADAATTTTATMSGVTNPVTGGTIPTAQTVLSNIAAEVPNLMQLTTALAYVMGMGFIIAGILKMKHFGEMRTMMSQEHGMLGPMVFLAVGAALLYLPTSVQVGMSTFWNNPSPLGYTSQEDQWNQFMSDCYLIIELIGTISFIRGLVILSHGGKGGQGGLAKGLTHVVAGIFCINIYQFVQMVFTTLGIS